MTEDRFLACAIRLLDCGLFRIGSESYAEENESYGLATMRRDHLRLEGNTMVFDCTAKG
jgi:DNA topoisomerase-1